MNDKIYREGVATKMMLRCTYIHSYYGNVTHHSIRLCICVCISNLHMGYEKV